MDIIRPLPRIVIPQDPVLSDSDLADIAIAKISEQISAPRRLLALGNAPETTSATPEDPPPVDLTSNTSAGQALNTAAESGTPAVGDLQLKLSSTIGQHFARLANGTSPEPDKARWAEWAAKLLNRTGVKTDAGLVKPSKDDDATAATSAVNPYAALIKLGVKFLERGINDLLAFALARACGSDLYTAGGAVSTALEFYSRKYPEVVVASGTAAGIPINVAIRLAAPGSAGEMAFVGGLCQQSTLLPNFNKEFVPYSQVISRRIESGNYPPEVIGAMTKRQLATLIRNQEYSKMLVMISALQNPVILQPTFLRFQNGWALLNNDQRNSLMEALNVQRYELGRDARSARAVGVGALLAVGAGALAYILANRGRR